MIKKISEEINHIIQFLVAIVMIVIFRIIGMKAASRLSGFITKVIGKRHRAHRIAYGNMARAMPEIDEKKRAELLDKMWMSLGGIVGEYVYVSRMSEERLDKIVEIDENSAKNLRKMKENSKGGIIFSAHIGNWDVGLRCFMVKGVRLNVLYRPLNNRYVDNLMCKIKEFDPIAKGRDGLRDIIAHIKRGEYVIIMADQRVGDGEMIKFFHQDALTTTSIARIALKYGVEIVPARSYRNEDGSGFKFEVGDPLEIEGQDEVSIMTKVNKILERWIRQTPSQWFWVHNRWK